MSDARQAQLETILIGLLPANRDAPWRISGGKLEVKIVDDRGTEPLKILPLRK